MRVTVLADGSATPTPPAPGASWISPAGLDVALTVAIVLSALLGRLFGKQAEAKKATDLLTIAKSYTATVKGVQSFRELAADPTEVNKLLALIESATNAAGVAEEHHAAAHAITEGAAPMPEVVAGVVEKVVTSDPLVAVRAATARLTRRVA